MTKRLRKDSEHLHDARDHLQMLQHHLSRGSLEDALIRAAVSHRLEVAIDAVGKISEDILRAEVPTEWPQIVGMRNMLAHQDADLDAKILQNTIDNRLDGLIQFVERLRSIVIAEEQR